ncbi:MAG: hypothetical protein IH855_01465 [Bacteroidetes bacterium]|nr:hypothetical protein [Bacteroidota bacterium]
MSEPIIIGPIGVLGAVIGSVATIAAQLAASHIDKKMREQREQPQLEMLDEMLRHEEHKWRSFGVLMHVIGADEETTKRLLLKVGARASEDGQPLWGLRSRNPLPGEKNDA